MKIFTNKGISILELIIIISILSMMIAIIIPGLSSFRNTQVINTTTNDVVSLLNLARSQTLSSLESSNYGVHFDANKATLFTGNVFTSEASTNKIVSVNSLTNIVNINLSGGGSDVVFSRFTGDTMQSGTIVISLISDNTKIKTITINGAGIISTN